jgi:hypothetical protein
MELTKAFISSLISSASYYRKTKEDEPNKLSLVFEDETDGKNILKKALLYEAYQGYIQEVNPNSVDDYSLLVVNLDTDPGIVVSTESDEGRIEVAYPNKESRMFNINEITLHPCPIPYDRHISALDKFSCDDNIRKTICKGEASLKARVRGDLKNVSDPLNVLSLVQLKEQCKFANLPQYGTKQKLIDRLKTNKVDLEPLIYSKGIRLIHGPPGTGKTHKIITDLKQMLMIYPKDKFLICATSNVGTVNLYTRSRDAGVKCSLIIREDKIPENTCTVEEIESWNTNDQVIFSTVSTRSGSKLKNVNFNVIFLDEAAQCQEAWFWGLLRQQTHSVIMAGDPYQLPALVSNRGISLNHHRSCMERLLVLDYESTLLNVQRRMHPDIVQFPNSEFYASKLKTVFPNLEEIDQPYQIIDINSSEQKVGTSYKNEVEAKIIQLLYNRYKKTYGSVVVIAPYKAQCAAIKKLDPAIEVHTVDSYQGKEAECVLLTTVRSGTEVGFWGDCRRLNVGLTRAKKVLRIVGSVKTWKHCNIMRRLAKDGEERQIIKQLAVQELLNLGVPIQMQDAEKYVKDLPWGHHLEISSKSRKRDDFHLARAIIKLAQGSKRNYQSGIQSFEDGGVITKWSVEICETYNIQHLKIWDVIKQGDAFHDEANIISSFKKRGTEWNNSCVYGEKPKTFESLPFKGYKVIKEDINPHQHHNNQRKHALNMMKEFGR